MFVAWIGVFVVLGEVCLLLGYLTFARHYLLKHLRVCRLILWCSAFLVKHREGLCGAHRAVAVGGTFQWQPA